MTRDHDFPSSLELKTLSLAVYHSDPDSAECCRDAVMLGVLALLLERRVAVDQALSIVVELQRSDFQAGDGRLVAGGEELRLRIDWLSAARRWLVFRGLREGSLFLAMENGDVVSKPLSLEDLRAVVQWYVGESTKHP